MAIRTIRSKGLRELFIDGRTSRIDSRLHNKILDLLDILDAATKPRDMVGVSGFHELKGERKGTHSLYVSRNWRITFRLDNGDAFAVDWEDYH